MSEQPSSSPRKKFRLHWPKPFMIDLSKGKDRWKVFIGFLILVVVGLGLLIGGVQGYMYSESTAFCGTICHSMMPQYTRHQVSAHSNVACAHCHVGPGAASFVQSKIDGTRQLIGEMLNNYQRPIPSPVENLRPARETCEECHSPKTFKDNIVKVIQHYANDKENTPVQTTLILKMGGWSGLEEVSRGIHWHIFSKVYYIPLDKQRQVIGWVGVEQEDGTLKEYFARDLLGMSQTEFVEKAREAGEIREMDCIDCHNRTAHYIPYPEQSVDTAIANGLISTDLPYVRAESVKLLDTEYNSEMEAMRAIEGLATYYEGQKSPKVTDEKVTQAVDTLKDIYSTTTFPFMKLTWETNPNNQRHTPTLGCFRCHDENHVTTTADGKQEVISAQCNLCHTVPIVGSGSDLVVEAPVIVGSAPETHTDYRWTVEHRSVTEAEKQECYNCHGQSFCNNGACHNLSHPEDMAFTHAEEVKKVGSATCYTCHQAITCTRCHPGGVDIFKP